jgi:hypothetical protein
LLQNWASEYIIPTWLFNFYRTIEPSSKVENTVGFLLVLVLAGWCYGYFQNKIPIHMKIVTDLGITMQFFPVLFMCLGCMSGEALVGLFHSVLHVCQFEWDKICDNKLILYFVKWATPCGRAWRWRLRKNCNEISIEIESKAARTKMFLFLFVFGSPGKNQWHRK